MNKITRSLIAPVVLLLLAHSYAAADTEKQRPNFLVVVLDDLGYSDLGVYGSEIQTPHINFLASRGVQFTDFHSGMTCSPTRAMLLSGVDSHQSGLGNMAGHMSNNQRGRPGYEGFLNQQVDTVASVLQQHGYQTYLSGKWHLGMQKGNHPVDRGFGRSFALLNAGASYFSDMRGLVERTPKASYVADDKIVESLPDDFHASEYFADRLIEFIESGTEDAPFFAYLALTAPHWPYQLPDNYLDRYHGQYDEGYDVARERRFAKMQKLGLVAADQDFPERLEGVPAWSSLSKIDRKLEARRMELYAALVEHADAQVGRVLNYLEKSGALDNTWVFVMSDNGPEGNDRSRIATNETWLPQAWDLSYENMGRRDSYVYYGPAWAQVSSTPFRLFKAFPTEGAIRVPLIVNPPLAQREVRLSDAPVTVRDIFPTLLGLAAITPQKTNHSVTTDSNSMLSHILNGHSPVHEHERVFGWELFGHRAIRRGDWKLVWIDSGTGQGNWSLFNLANDPSESRDVADDHPDTFKQMLLGWQAYVKENQVVLPTDNQSSAFGYEGMPRN